MGTGGCRGSDGGRGRRCAGSVGSRGEGNGRVLSQAVAEQFCPTEGVDVSLSLSVSEGRVDGVPKFSTNGADELGGEAVPAGMGVESGNVCLGLEGHDELTEGGPVLAEAAKDGEGGGGGGWVGELLLNGGKERAAGGEGVPGDSEGGREVWEGRGPGSGVVSKASDEGESFVGGDEERGAGRDERPDSSEPVAGFGDVAAERLGKFQVAPGPWLARAAVSCPWRRTTVSLRRAASAVAVSWAVLAAAFSVRSWATNARVPWNASVSVVATVTRNTSSSKARSASSTRIMSSASVSTAA